jgi:ATP-dependent Clp protease ATP-binding subunit ClpA
MVEPSKELQLVFDKAINDAKKLMHEYVTLEHLLYAIFCEEKFCNIVGMYGADLEYIKSNLEHHLKDNMKEIITDDDKAKPKKTHTVERVLNRAFTQVLFAGRNNIARPTTGSNTTSTLSNAITPKMMKSTARKMPSRSPKIGPRMRFTIMLRPCFERSSPTRRVPVRFRPTTTG